MIDEGAQFKADFSDDLRPHVQRGERVLPAIEGQ